MDTLPDANILIAATIPTVLARRSPFQEVRAGVHDRPRVAQPLHQYQDLDLQDQ